jgi:hypothetical protein
MQKRTPQMLIIAALCLLLAACSPNPAASPASSTPRAASVPTAIPAVGPSPTPIAVGFIYWALDRGPEGTPDQASLRIYLFVVRDLVGPVRLLAQDGSVVGTADVLGSGIFSTDSCVARVPKVEKEARLIGIVQMTADAQAAFLANPTTYRVQVDRTFATPAVGSAVYRLVDSGCRPG